MKFLENIALQNHIRTTHPGAPNSTLSVVGPQAVIIVSRDCRGYRLWLLIDDFSVRKSIVMFAPAGYTKMNGSDMSKNLLSINFVKTATCALSRWRHIVKYPFIFINLLINADGGTIQARSHPSRISPMRCLWRYFP